MRSRTKAGSTRPTRSARLYSQRDNGAGHPVIDITVGYNGSTSNSGNMSVLVRDDTGVAFAQVNGSAGVDNGQWHHFAVTRTAGTIEVYVDGASIGSAMGAGVSSSITTGASGSYQNIGQEGNWVQTNYGTLDQRFLAATFDEFRISNTLRSDDWLVTDYNTMSSPSSTYALGSETLASCGDGTKIAGEGCDDGNFMSGDGCSSACGVETGYYVHGHGAQRVHARLQRQHRGRQRRVRRRQPHERRRMQQHLHRRVAVPLHGVAQRLHLRAVQLLQDRHDRPHEGRDGVVSDDAHQLPGPDQRHRQQPQDGRQRWPRRNTNGYDIVFRGLDATTCGGPTACTFAHEVEKYDGTTGQLVAWVNVPALKAQTNTDRHDVQHPVRKPRDLDQHGAAHVDLGLELHAPSGT